VTIRVGIGGWVYPPWRGAFYPKGLRQAEELAYASQRVTAIEINGTFYRTQTPASYRRWHDETPEDFVFSLKGPRYVTHRGDFAEAGPSLDRFLSSGLTKLRGKLGPILWQFAPMIPIDDGAFAAFLNLLPQSLDNRPLRHVVEVPEATPAMLEALRRHRVAVALIDDAKRPMIEEITSDFVYARLRRSVQREPAGYAPEALDAWAARARQWAAERDCFVYFINGAKVRAPAAAQALIQLLKDG
jgi:uncharacterized protein YecE (DUF72 family)